MSEKKKEIKNESKAIKMMFSETELNIVIAALGEMPAKQSMNLIMKIHEQYKENKID